MALIKCPECGREGVSEYAEACPSCGFVIREYVQLVKEEQEKREKEEKERIEREKWEREKRERENNERNKIQSQREEKYKRKMKEIRQSLQTEFKKIDMEKPLSSKPKVFNYLIMDWGSNIFCIAFIFLTLYLSFLCFSSSLPMLVKVLGVLFCLCFCSTPVRFLKDTIKSNFASYQQQLNLYKYQNSIPWEKYKQRKIQEAIETNTKRKEELIQKYKSGEDF